MSDQEPAKVVSDGSRLFVFVDAQPSEQLQHHDDTRITITGVICQGEPVEDLRQYKLVAPPDRTAVAERLAERLECDDPWVAVASYSITQQEARVLGRQALELAVQQGVVERRKRAGRQQVRLGGQTIGETVAEAMGAYALALLGLGVWAASLARRRNLRELVFLLDKLPGNAAGAMDLVQAISKGPNLGPLWADLLQPDLSLQVGNMHTAEPTDGSKPPWAADDDPSSCLADWMAQSVYAALCAQEWLALGPDRLEEHRRAIANLWFILEGKSRSRANILALDRVRMDHPTATET